MIKYSFTLSKKDSRMLLMLLHGVVAEARMQCAYQMIESSDNLQQMERILDTLLTNRKIED